MRNRRPRSRGRHEAWDKNEDVKQQTKTRGRHISRGGRPTRAALGEPSPEIYCPSVNLSSRSGPDSRRAMFAGREVSRDKRNEWVVETRRSTWRCGLYRAKRNLLQPGGDFGGARYVRQQKQRATEMVSPLRGWGDRSLVSARPRREPARDRQQRVESVDVRRPLERVGHRGRCDPHSSRRAGISPRGRASTIVPVEGGPVPLFREGCS
jgi:hypothetical protein